MDSKMKRIYFIRLFALFLSDLKKSILMMVLLIVSGVMTGIAPRILGFCTDVLASGLKDMKINWDEFAKWAAVAAVVYILQFLTKWISGVLSASLSAGVAKKLRSKVEEKLWKMPLNYYDVNSNGDIMSRTTNDIDNIEDTLNKTGGDMLYYILQLICMVVMMLMLSWVLAIATMIIIPLSFYVVKLITKHSRPQYKKQWSYMGELNGNVEESFKGHDIIKA